MDLLGKQLSRFRTIDDLERLARSLFDKDNQLFKDFQEEISRQSNKQEIVATARHFLFSTIEKVIDKEFKRKVKLPDRLENYISFCDLHLTSRHLDDRVWYTLLLRDLPDGLHESKQGNDPLVPINSIRKAFKRKLVELEPKIVASVQLEVKIANDDFELFLFRVSTFIKTRNLKPENEEARLCKTRPAFFGLYPGEPYIYSDSEHPNELYLKAWVELFQCTGITNIPLKGKNIEDLRKMRLLKNNEANALDELDSKLPKLQDFNLSAGSEGKQTCVHFRGKNIFTGLEAFLQNDIFKDGEPRWVEKAKRKGRNSLRIVRNRENSNRLNFDQMSIAASDFTVIG